MRRDLPVVILAVVILAAIAVILSSLLSEPARAEITAITTDKDLYHSDEVMKITISANATQKMDNTTVRIEGIEDWYGKMHLSHEIPVTLSPGPVVFTYDYKLPSCSKCSGLPYGVYKINVTLIRNGAIISNMTRPVQIG
jgi:hypothetical protein